MDGNKRQKDMQKIVGEEQPTSSLEDRYEKKVEVDRMKELRERLYAREGIPQKTVRHQLPPLEIDRHEVFSQEKFIHSDPIQVPTPTRLSDQHTDHVTVVAENKVPYTESMSQKKRRFSFRKIAVISTMVFFLGALGISSLLMFSGNNTISGENISIDMVGPIVVGGGEDFTFQVSLGNQNSVSIQSATLIIEYPPGTHSSSEIDKTLTTERKSLETINAGELVNATFKARMYGEENTKKEIQARIEYRIVGSNATFEKKAEPLTFTISTSPVLMVFEVPEHISSGQEAELKLVIQANSPTPLSDIVVKVSYPDGFDFTSSKPETASGEDTWKISSFEPNEKKIITIKGLITGYENDIREFHAIAGVADERDKNSLASQLITANARIIVEQSSLDVGMTINGNAQEIVSVRPDALSVVKIAFTNMLDTTLYNGKISVELKGNAIEQFVIEADHNGFYDSNTKTIHWSVDEVSSLKEILPGSTIDLSVFLNPKESIGNASELGLSVGVVGQRISGERAQDLVGITERTIKVESTPQVSAMTLYETGPFTNSGLTPPVAETVTQYSVVLKVQSGINDLIGGEVVAVLPTYIRWLDLISDGHDISYNIQNHTIKWAVGDLEAREKVEVAFQVSFRPSLSQVGMIPTILEAQRFRATDRFTGTVVRADNTAITTKLSNNGEEDTGKVRSNE